MRPISDIVARRAGEERDGCEAALLALSLFRSDIDDCSGHPSDAIEDYIDSLQRTAPDVMTSSAGRWVREHVRLGDDVATAMRVDDFARAGFPPDALRELGKLEDSYGRATIQTSAGRLVCFLSSLVYVNFDDPSAGFFFDTF